MTDMLANARDLLARGFSVIPLDHPDDTWVTDPNSVGKTAAIKWTPFQKARPTDAHLVEWFSNGRKRNAAIPTPSSARPGHAQSTIRSRRATHPARRHRVACQPDSARTGVLDDQNTIVSTSRKETGKVYSLRHGCIIQSPLRIVAGGDLDCSLSTAHQRLSKLKVRAIFFASADRARCAEIRGKRLESAIQRHRYIRPGGVPERPYGPPLHDRSQDTSIENQRGYDVLQLTVLNRPYIQVVEGSRGRL
jgi:hypothetical protein